MSSNPSQRRLPSPLLDLNTSAARLFALAACCCISCASSLGQGGSVAGARLPPKQRTVLLFKALTYDRQLTQGRDALRIGVIGKQGDAESVKMAQATAQQMHGVESMRIRGLKISEELILASSAADVQREVGAKRVNIIYLGAGTESMIDQICALAEGSKIIVLSGEADHARRCAAVTVVGRDNKPKVLLNLRAAAAQGASFDPALVGVSEVVQ